MLNKYNKCFFLWQNTVDIYQLSKVPLGTKSFKCFWYSTWNNTSVSQTVLLFNFFNMPKLMVRWLHTHNLCRCSMSFRYCSPLFNLIWHTSICIFITEKTHERKVDLPYLVSQSIYLDYKRLMLCLMKAPRQMRTSGSFKGADNSAEFWLYLISQSVNPSYLKHLPCPWRESWR